MRCWQHHFVKPLFTPYDLPAIKQREPVEYNNIAVPDGLLNLKSITHFRPYEVFHQRHVSHAQKLSEFLARLRWCKVEIDAERACAPRDLTETRHRFSPWHRAQRVISSCISVRWKR
jgi:hypothetical protein